MTFYDNCKRYFWWNKVKCNVFQPYLKQFQEPVGCAYNKLLLCKIIHHFRYGFLPTKPWHHFYGHYYLIQHLQGINFLWYLCTLQQRTNFGFRQSVRSQYILLLGHMFASSLLSMLLKNPRNFFNLENANLVVQPIHLSLRKTFNEKLNHSDKMGLFGEVFNHSWTKKFISIPHGICKQSSLSFEHWVKLPPWKNL